MSLVGRLYLPLQVGSANSIYSWGYNHTLSTNHFINNKHQIHSITPLCGLSGEVAMNIRNLGRISC